MIKKNILFVVSECQNFAVTGGLADVAGSLPTAINNESEEFTVHVIMPLYQVVKNNYGEKLKFLGEKIIHLSWRKQLAKIYYLKYKDINYYFVDNVYYFNRSNLYGYHDDIERFAFFAKSIINVFDIIGFVPDIIHAHDWQGSLVNIYLKIEKRYQIKTILTIHNIEYQGIFASSQLEDITGIDFKYFDILEHNGSINLLKGGILCSNIVTTVSKQYAKEIQTTQYGHGLHEIIKKSKDKLYGIINGIDLDFYNPEKDANLIANYNHKSIDRKVNNKLKLQEELKLKVDKDIVVIAIISRLVAHKGIDLVIQSLSDLLNENIQIIVLGTGDKYYEEEFTKYAYQYPNKVASLIKFDINLAKKIYGGADLFLMPSATEPCGLSQMIASRYGTVPIVRKTGGLADTIKDYSYRDGNGFVFTEYSNIEMINKIKEAINLYNDKEKFNKLVKKVMKKDFSWSQSAKEYIRVYRQFFN